MDHHKVIGSALLGLILSFYAMSITWFNASLVHDLCGMICQILITYVTIKKLKNNGSKNENKPD